MKNTKNTKKEKRNRFKKKKILKKPHILQKFLAFFKKITKKT